MKDLIQRIPPAGGAARAGTVEAFVRAGPRAAVVFHGDGVSAAIVTCGGLCPGLNNVVRDLVLRLRYNYNVQHVYGIRDGYRGFYAPDALPPFDLTPASVADIHMTGGTILGSSRGGFDLQRIMDGILALGVSVVFCVGGDGTMRGAFELYREIERRKLPIAIAGVPKTIDNDIPFMDRTFGFHTAVREAVKAIHCAKVEAKSDHFSVAIVQLMGRSAGFIAIYAALASGNVDLVLIPESQFDMDGERGVVTHLHKRLRTQGHAVVVVAEGAGQHIVPPTGRTDPSGNPVLPAIGEYLKAELKKSLGSILDRYVSVRLIDPSYIVRSVPASADDAMLCMLLASEAVHGAMAGMTGFVAGLVNNRTVYIPIELINSKKPKRVNVRGRMWERVLMMTRQARPLLELASSL